MVPCLPHKNIVYGSITERSHTFNMVASGVHIICFDLESILCGLKLLLNYHVTKF